MDEEEHALMIGDGKNANKKRKGTMDIDSPISAGLGMGAASSSVAPVRKVRSAKEIAQGMVVLFAITCLSLRLSVSRCCTLYTTYGSVDKLGCSDQSRSPACVLPLI